MTATTQMKIVGGSATTIEERPWQVALRHDGEFVCGGSILSNRYILTAQHCVEGVGLSSLSIAAGFESLMEMDAAAIRGVSEVYTAPGYVEPSAGSDVAVLRLDSTLDLTLPTMESIGLVTALEDEAGATNTGVAAAISGWGTTREGGEISEQLLGAEVPIVANETAAAAYGPEGITITADQLGAGFMGIGGVDACQGDSGGPLTVDVGGVTKLAGVVSWGFGCADPEFPGMYARVSSFEGWVTPLTTSSLVTAVRRTSLSGTRSSWRHYSFTVPEGAVAVGAKLTGGSGDADLYLRYGARPTSSTYDCRPYLEGNTEWCGLGGPTPGKWYASIKGYANYSGVTLVMRYRDP